MPPKRTTVASTTIDTPARDHFYRLARNHIDSLNVKFREKAVITRPLSETITEALQNKPSHEKKASLFLRWCRQSFVLRPIGGHQVLCDIKNVKPVLLFEDMYDVYQDSHQQMSGVHFRLLQLVEPDAIATIHRSMLCRSDSQINQTSNCHKTHHCLRYFRSRFANDLLFYQSCFHWRWE